LTTKWNPPVDPSLSYLVCRAESDWGDPASQRKSLVPWGIHIFDEITYGIDLNNGGLIVIQGEEKNRKTTFFLNIVKNICTCNRWPDGWRIAVDLAESGMPPTKYRDMLISMVATEILVKWHWSNNKNDYGDGPYQRPLESLLVHEWPQDRMAEEVLDIPHLGIEPKFLRYMRRTDHQHTAIAAAIRVVAHWPVDIYGPTKNDGDTRNYTIARQRWDYAIERGAHIICYDHAQQMNINGTNGDYDKLEVFVPLVANTVVSYPGLVFVAISQVSMGSVAAGKLAARGGKKLAEEANDVINVSYSVDYSDGDVIRAHTVIELAESRTSPTCKVKQDIEPASGLFVMDAYL